MMKIMRRNYFFAALALCGVLMVPALGAQTLDQTTLGQVDVNAGITSGAAPTVAPALPAVGTLSSSQTAGTAVSVEQAVAQPSAIETMFAGQMAALGIKAPALTQFGYSLFDNPVVPSLSSIGDDYVLGPGDGLVLYLWGDPVDIKELSSAYSLTVDRNGNLFLPPAGQISVLGQNLGSVRSVIKGMLDRRYKKLELSLTLSTLRQFPVNVSGYVGKPGTVLATGADTVFSVLSRAGGIAKTGSLRSVRFVRGATTKTIDFYDMLISGSSIDLRVKEGDSVYVPAIGPVAAFAGELRRPGIYELPGTSDLTSALGLAGGLLPSARSSGVTRLSFSESGRNLANGSLSDAGFAGSAVSDGDFFYVGAASDLLIGQVQVSGPVKYAGKYQTTSVSTLSALLTRAQLLPETNLYYGRVYRTDLSGRDKSFAFSPEDVLAGADIGLTDFDRVVLYRYDDTSADPEFDRFSNTLMLSGPVKYPGFYLYKTGMKLSEVLTKEQVLLDTNMNYGELTRLKGDGKNEYVTFRPGEVLGGSWDLTLGPRDVIKLVKVGYAPEEPDFDRYGDVVQVSGPVEFGGLYAWRGGMKLSGLLGLAKPKLDTNQVYAEVARLGTGGITQTLTFALREVNAGTFDMDLSARDTVRLFSNQPVQVLGTQTDPNAKPATAGNGQQNGQPVVSPATAAQAIASGQAGVAGQPGAVGQPGGPMNLGFFLDIVSVRGQVRYEGPYARTPTLKLSSVVTPDQILETTDLEYAELTRRNADGSWSYKTFSPREVLAGTWDMPLQAQDSIQFFQAGYLPEKPDYDRFGDVYAITGAAKFTGLYAMHGTKLLSDILTDDQLLGATDIHYAEIDRWVAGGRTEYLTFSPSAVLKGEMDMNIFPRDVIRLVTAGQNGDNHDFTRYPNTVVVKGIVSHPGRFAWYKGLSLSSILNGDELLIDTDVSYAEIRRRNADRETILNFSPASVAAGGSDVALEARDVIILYPKYYNKPVSVSGEVVEPKVIPYYEGIELAAVLRSVTLKAGINSLKAVVTKAAGGSQDVYLEDYLHRQAAQKVILAPGDAVSIKMLLPDENLPIVTVRGAVGKPQSLDFKEGMRLSDALAGAGGYGERAYPKGLVLIRKTAAEAQQKQVERLMAQLEAMSSAGAALPTSTDTSLSSTAATIANMQIDLVSQRSRLGMLKQLYKEGFGRISIDMPDTLQELAASPSNIVLERDDMIFVPTTPTYVLVSGDVADQAVVAYHDGIKVRDAIALSGWLNNSADMDKAYIIKASGRLVSTEGKGGIFSKPTILDYKLEPGDTVVVPSKTAKVSQTWSYIKDVVDIAYKIMTTALTTVSLLGLL